MGKLVVTEFVTLDGVMEDPGGGEKDTFDRGGWAFRFDRGEDGDRFKFDELMAADVQLLGRRTYEGFARAWPSMDQDEFGQKMNAMEKVVYSSTLEDPSWNNTTVIRGDLRDQIEALKERTERRHPRRRERAARAGPRRGGARRRAPPHGLPGRSRRGQAAVRRLARAAVHAGGVSAVEPGDAPDPAPRLTIRSR